MSFELVILDCDGVLVDSEPISRAVLSECFATFGFAMTRDQNAIVFEKGGSLANEIRAVEELFARPVPETFTAAYRSLLYERLVEVPPIPGVVDALDELNLPTCVASNGPMEKMRVTLGAIHLWERFEGRVFSAYEIEHPKPAPDLFLTAARALDANPSRCVVVEDSLPGVRAGRAAGMTVCAYVAEASPEEISEMREAQARTFSTMGELPGLLRELEKDCPS
jgi:HAD superfamily hydrolase (TIGR01509 family)